MRKNRIKILTLSSFMLMGLMLCQTQNNRNDIHMAKAADEIATFNFDDATLEATSNADWDTTIEAGAKSNQYGKFAQKDYNNKASVSTGAFYTTYISTSNKSVYLTSKNEFGEISSITFQGGSSDKNKVHLKVETSLTGDFSDANLLYDDTFYNTGARNNTGLQACSILPSTNSGGYLRFGFYASSTGKSTWMDDLVITHAGVGEKYDVSFVDGTTTLSTQTIKENECATAPELPDEIGKVFVGWSDGTSVLSKDVIDAKPVTGPVTYTAIWEEATTFTVTFQDYEGAEPRTVTMNAGPLGELDDPEPRKDFEFLGWYTTATFDEGTQVTAETPLSENIILYGKWQAATYVYVTFDVDGITEQYHTFEGRALNTWPVDPVEEGKVFVGWFDADGNQYTSTSTFNTDTTLVAKWNLILNVSYVFDDYGILPPEKDPDFALVSNDVTEIKTYGYNKGNSDAPITYGEKSYKNYVQAKGLTIKLTNNATVEVICSQTSTSHTRKMMVMDKEGRIYNLNQIPAAKKQAGAISINLLAGEYTVLTTEGSYNFYGINVDYTYAETITSDLIGLKSTKLNNQAGYDANHNESMRFVGEIDYAPVNEITSIYLSISSTKLVDGVETNESIFEGNIYTVYDRVTLTEGAKYGVVENRLYFYYIVDGLNDTYKTVTCNASINLADSTVYNLNSVFDYKVSFGK